VNRVAVIGSGGAGKSVFSRELGRRTGLPVIHLDVEFWSPGWVPMDDEPWEARVRELAAGDGWIMDGNYGGTMSIRFERADTIIFLDLPRLVCVVSAIWRSVRYRGANRPDMTEGNRERLDLAFLAWIWNYPRTRRPGIVRQLDALPPSTQVIRLTSRRAARKWLDRIMSTPVRPAAVAR
jgi:adenylate kinase family enzyme